ncbi:MAG: HDOD domain-containing protein [Bryobacterales bacterium]|nr:HDOD domain-containing protein [Bryobacteraceae bacterium]MDW8128952.1 HDOD domain-containing protein [Bryobacterales bacterium]
MKSLERLPPFSPVLNRLLASLAHEDVSFAELATLIEKDTVLAGNILRLVNSALYGLPGTVSSVRHAVAILGLVKLRNVLLGLAISRLWRTVRTPPGWSTAQFNLHSAAVATLADLLVEAAPVPYAEGAFVAGLLHDMGKLLWALAFPRQFALLWNLLGRCGGRWADCEAELLGLDHAELSSEALARWNLPEPIRRAARFHHVPELANAGALDLAHVVHAANLLAAERGFGMLPSGIEPAPSAARALDRLGVTPALPRILERFQEEMEVIATLLR